MTDVGNRVVWFKRWQKTLQSHAYRSMARDLMTQTSILPYVRIFDFTLKPMTRP
jgi:hypothetical protein